MRRLWPDPAEVGVLEALEEFPPQAPQGRPFVALNMVASADGRATVDGRTSPLSSKSDRAMFHGLRERVDCVMVGAGTVRAETYGRMIKDPDARLRREGLGLDSEPVTAVVSRSGDVPLDGAVVGHDPAGLLRALEAEHSVRSVLCEGGPMLNRHLLAQGLVDELFLTLSAQLVGGEDPLTILRGPPLEPPVGLELVWLLEGEGDLLVRWRLL
ncbi:MAG: dihydrofolate reductase family protein [Actinomycetota bacterium]|nr:dihydrofolate reductase family protein [Actinomycetota bacterium]